MYFNFDMPSTINYAQLSCFASHCCNLFTSLIFATDMVNKDVYILEQLRINKSVVIQ